MVYVLGEAKPLIDMTKRQEGSYERKNYYTFYYNTFRQDIISFLLQSPRENQLKKQALSDGINT